MAVRRPLVVISGAIKELPTGDTVPGSGSTTLSALTDVTLTTPSNGQVLKYNGSVWINGTDNTGGGGGGNSYFPSGW